MEVEGATTVFADGDDVQYSEELRRPYYAVMTIQHLRDQQAADKAAGQCRADVVLYVDGSRTLVDVAVGDATAPSYRRPPPLPHPPPTMVPDSADPASSDARHCPPLSNSGRQGTTASKRGRRRSGAGPAPSPLLHPRLPGQSFAMEHRVSEKKSKFRPFLGAEDVDEPSASFHSFLKHRVT